MSLFKKFEISDVTCLGLELLLASAGGGVVVDAVKVEGERALACTPSVLSAAGGVVGGVVSKGGEQTVDLR